MEWTPQDDSRLIALLTGPERLSLRVISKTMGLNKAIIRNRVIALGYKTAGGRGSGRLRRYTTEKLEEIRVMRDEGLSVEEIGYRTGIEPEKIRSTCRHYHLLSARTWRHAEVELLRSMREQGKSTAEMAKALARSWGAVHHKLGFLDRPAREKRAPKTAEESKREIIVSKLRQSARRSRDKEQDYDLTYEWVIQQLDKQGDRCHYSGAKIGFTRSHGDIFSLDRLDSTKPYIQDNVVICTWDANRMKQDMSVSRFVEMCRMIVTHHGST